MSDAAAILRELQKELHRRWDEESLARARKCVEMLTEEQLWHRFNEHALTAGNILLHLRGNIRQWVVCALGGKPDDRHRDGEFAADRAGTKKELFDGLESTVREALAIVDALEPEQLLKPVSVQGFSETGLSILVHVTEHFSYHVGELTYITKLVQNVDTRYYDSARLRAKN